MLLPSTNRSPASKNFSNDTTVKQEDKKSDASEDFTVNSDDKGTQTFTSTYTASSFKGEKKVGEEQNAGSHDDYNDNEEYENTVKRQILDAALNHVHEFGWTNQALEAGAKSEGLPSVAHGMFPRGGAELVEHFYVRCNADLAQYLKQEVERLKAENKEKPPVKPFIKNAVETRLKMILPYKDVWPQAMGIQTLPQNAPHSWKNLMNLADEIWYYAGDRSVDFNWYTKRFILATIYKSSEIYMLQDKSADHQSTWNFLDRRLNDVQKFGSTRKQLSQSGSVLKEGFSGFCTVGRNILGMNSRNR